MDLGLAGRRAIVTGGSKGLGQAIAAELLAEGAQVAICSRNAAELEATAAELRESARAGSAGNRPASNVVALPCDVTDPAQVTQFVDAAASALGGGAGDGGIDILVNNAGGARPGRVRSPTGARWHGRFAGQVASPNPPTPRGTRRPRRAPLP